jgi:hypothetical protein
LAARKQEATDWFFGVRIGLDADGGQAIEYHHINPQSTLKKGYSKTEINDLANLSFISSRANKRISNRSPASYFPEVGESELERHLVPLADDLRTVPAYPAFIAARRELLAQAMTELLDSYRPSMLEAGPTFETATNRLIVTAFPPIDGHGSNPVEFRAQTDSLEWVGSTTVGELETFLTDIEAGLTAGLAIGAEMATIEGGQDSLEVPIGPFVVTGSTDQWRAMVARETEQMADIGSPSPPSEPWAGPRSPFSVAEAE